ncbi:DUF945 family protein [Halomonas sp. PAMB 3232]|uniref:DUF945 family protein n=1 Tax=Halomonas sp. PAMB 3232 TaxID=3075221 RepID=UPI00289D02EC|nr:DUF945 family protein [Halomonas sp. PAMB 3232]WNL37431.1 DUF945 family protein [Halomonas sp. PAMB 3232]
MAVSSKALVIVGAVVVVGAGGYLGAQAIVGNEVEKSLNQAFERIDASPGWRVTDIEIDRSLFETNARATLGAVGFEDATAALDLHVDHGVLKSPVTGTLHPNEALFEGDIDIDMVASWSGAEGQLTADTLGFKEFDGEATGVVMALDIEDDTRWHVDTRIEALGFTYVDGSVVRLTTPRFEMDTRGDEGSEVVQRLELPRAEIATQGLNIYLDDVVFDALTQPSAELDDNPRRVDQAGTFKVADVGVDGTSMGSLSMEIAAERWDMQAFQDYNEAFAMLSAQNYRRERDPASFDEARYRESLTQAIDNGYTVLASSPAVSIDPLEAHIVVPALNLDFKPQLKIDMGFDGENLSREALFSLARHTDTPARELITPQNAPMSEAQANAYLSERVHFEASMVTPPEAVMDELPLMARFLIDAEREQQTLKWEQGQLTLNGETLF